MSVKEIVITSGKGGTGKTTVVAAFAALAENAVLADCDVDAADLHLILDPDVRKREDFWSGYKAVIDLEKCTECGKCREVCRFGAISEDYIVDRIACEGCGVCYEFCPDDAIPFKENRAGESYISNTRFGPMVHAKLRPAEGNSGKLVSLVRREARRIAEEQKRDLIIADGSPGIGCAVIASITGADHVLVVTEPTVSGHHDMDRVMDLAKHFGVPVSVCVNKYDLNLEMTMIIDNYCRKRGAKVVGRIPFDPVFVKAMVDAKTIFEYTDGPVCDSIRKIWESTSAALKP
jgi:MinD superfamily P-loop ATPase